MITNEAIDYVKSVLGPLQRTTAEAAYNAGYDCGKNGATMQNCDFHLFSSPLARDAWSEGKADAEAGRLSRYAQRTKRRYNLCHRLRAAGIEVDVVNHAIQATDPEQVENLMGTTARRLRALIEEFNYVVQFRIPDAPGSTVVGEQRGFAKPATKFTRRKRPPERKTENPA